MRFCDGVYVSGVYVWVRVRVCRRFARSKLTWVLFCDGVYMSGVYIWVCVRVCRRCKLTWVLFYDGVYVSGVYVWVCVWVCRRCVRSRLTWVLFYDGVYVLGVYVWVCVWVCRRFVRSRLTWVRRTFCSTSASLWTAAFSCQTLWTRSQWPPTRTTSSRKTSRNSVSFSEDLREIMRCSMKTLRRNFALFSEILVKFCVVQWEFKKLCFVQWYVSLQSGCNKTSKVPSWEDVNLCTSETWWKYTLKFRQVDCRIICWIWPASVSISMSVLQFDHWCIYEWMV